MAEAEMKKIRSEIAGIACDTTMTRGMALWEAIERTIAEHHVDLIVAGTHGRTGVPKLLLGSVAEEVFRRSPVPVLTVGPHAGSNISNGVRFNRVLFATDFGVESEAAAPYALSLAQDNHAQLILLHVMRKASARNPADVKEFEEAVARAIDRLYKIIPNDAALYPSPEVLVEYGEPSDRIMEVAKERRADLIVLGVRNAAEHLGAATHLERAIAHKVVTHAVCPVLTVRRSNAGSAARTTPQ
jgi:nucleotide-binding universal stress UspA family protein